MRGPSPLHLSPLPLPLQLFVYMYFSDFEKLSAKLSDFPKSRSMLLNFIGFFASLSKDIQYWVFAVWFINQTNLIYYLFNKPHSQIFIFFFYCYFFELYLKFILITLYCIKSILEIYFGYRMFVPISTYFLCQK